MAKLKSGTRVYGGLTVDTTLNVADVTISGNLTIQGTTTTVDTTVSRIKDPLLDLGGGENGAALTSDDGKERGLLMHYFDTTAKDAYLGWHTSNAEFAFAKEVTVNSDNVTVITSYGNLHALHYIGEGDTLGNITGANVTGTVNNANMSAYAGNVTGNAQGNITSLGTLTGLTVDGTTSLGILNANGLANYSNTTEAVSITTGAVVVAGGVGIGANLHVGGNIYGNFAGNIKAKGNNTEVQFNDNGAQNASPAFTFNKVSNVLTVTGNISGGNLTTQGEIQSTGTANVGNLVSPGYANITGNLTAGNISTAGVANVTGTANVGNLVSGGYANITGNVSGGNLSTLGTLSANIGNIGGNLSAGNISTAGVANVTGTANVGNLVTGGYANVTGTANVGNLVSGGYANISGDVTGGNIISNGIANITGNVIGGNLLTNGTANIGNLVIKPSGTITGNLVPIGNGTQDLGSVSNGWGNLYLTGTNLQLGTQTLSSNASGFSVPNTFYTNNVFANLANIGNANIGNLSGADANIANIKSNSLTSGRVTFASTGGLLSDSANLTFDTASNTLAATLITGTLTTNAQPNITSVGTLTDLTVTNVANANINGYSSTVSNASQPNITSVGTLTSLVVSGNIQSNANLITDTIVAKTTDLTIKSAGTVSNIILQPQGAGIIDASNVKIGNVATPTSSSDAATKGYVDSVASGLDVKESVRLATATNITLSGTQTIDGVSAIVGDRILVKAQTDKKQNGIYVVASGSWTRAVDANTDTVDGKSKITGGTFTFVEEGSLFHDVGFVVSSNQPITVGTSDIEWTQFSSAGTYTASSGVKLTGLEFSANVDNSTIDIYNNQIHVKDGLTLVTPNIGAATGTSLNLSTGNLTAANISFVSGNISNVDNISANTVTGTLTTAAQPNVTSVGNLTSLTIAGGNLSTNSNIVIDAGGSSSIGVYSNNYFYGNGTPIDFQSANGNAFEIQFHANGANDLAASSNFTFNSDTNLLTVNASANITTINSGNITSNANIIGANITSNALTSGRVTFAGSAGLLSDSANLTFSTASGLSVSANITSTQNLVAANITSNALTSGRVTFAGSAGLLSDNANLTYDAGTNQLKMVNAGLSGNLVAANITSNALSSGRVTFAGSAGLLSDNANLTYDIPTKTLTVDNLNATNGNVAAAYVSGNGSALSSITGANVTGQVANALLAGTVYTNAQPNITSVGNLTTLTVTGTTDLGNVGNVKITGGNANAYLKTDGTGNLIWAAVDSTKIVNGTSEVSIPTVNGDIQMTRGGNLVVTITGTGANITGYIDVNGNINGNNINAANLLTANANVDSYSSTSGTLLVTGGIGATGNIYTGHSIGFANNNGGNTSKAYIQYNSTADSLDFIFN